MKLIANLFAAVLGLALISSQALADDRPRRADFSRPQSPSLEAGRKAVDGKDFKSAVEHLAKAAKETPNDADVHNLLGYSYRHQGQFEKSMEHYSVALKIDPNHRGAHEYIGELYLQMDQLVNAEQQLQALSKACPWFGRCQEHEDLKAAIEKHKAKKTAAR
jgi:Flp pilus assembly protein TadD